jgi:integrase
MTKLLLNKQSVGSADCREGAQKTCLFDAGCRGLMLEVRATGRKTYYLRYLDDRGHQRQYRLGDARDLSLEAARRQADRLRARIIDGHDPAAARAEKRKTPRFEDFVGDFYLPFARSYKRSVQTDESLLKNHLLPAFGRRYMDDLTRQEVQAFVAQKSTTHKPASVNRMLILLRFIFNQALKWEVAGVSSNPTHGVRQMKENNQKERYLTEEEAQRLYLSVCQSENPSLQYIVALLILTGARKSEVLQARWGDFDCARRLWRIPTSKSGRARHVPLGDGVIETLQLVPRQPLTESVFPNPTTGRPYTSIFSAWNAARKRAGLAEVRIHDLRHSFASALVNQGRSLYEVQKILGHSQIKTTQRYAHLANETLVAAANTASSLLELNRSRAEANGRAQPTLVES